jgi:protease IV
MSDVNKTDAGTAWTESPPVERAKGAGVPEGWERDLLNRLAFSALSEQRRARRWSIFFRALLFLYLFILLFVFLSDGLFTTRQAAARHTALVEVQGIIADNAEASADRIVGGLRAAFEDTRTAGVILRINSPGGSPVQAGYVYDEIARLREKHPDIPLYAVITDMGASGGYFIAAAADEIYANQASVVGSIGVVLNSFGFSEAMERLGIERRLLTAGEYKGMLDPFSPTQADELEHVQALLDTIHQQFVDVVKRGRGDRLQAPDEMLFSGLIWTGEQGVELGLIDGLASSSFVAREIIGVETIVDFTRRPDFFERFAQRTGVAAAQALARLGASPQF